MWKLILIGLTMSFAQQNLAKPVSVREVKYDQSQDRLMIFVQYKGGCETHAFRLRMLNCTMPQHIEPGELPACSAVVEDTSLNEDRCHVDVHQWVPFEMSAIKDNLRPLVVTFNGTDTAVLVTDARL